MEQQPAPPWHGAGSATAVKQWGQTPLLSHPSDEEDTGFGLRVSKRYGQICSTRLVDRTEPDLQQRRGHLSHLSLIHISEPTRLGMISYAVFCLKKKNTNALQYNKDL